MATMGEEEYLERIYWLWEAELPITGANIARAMQVSAPTVHEMVGRLAKDGFVTRVMASTGGALVILAVATGIFAALA